jgi:UDP-hydrolysing UDP-N-acetyl-D-glucosamine 2-epimerase
VKRVCVYSANRSEYTRLKSVMEAIRDHPELELFIVISGSHLLNRYGDTVTEIERDGFAIEERIYTVIEGENLETMAKTAGLTVIELTTVFSNLKPDVLLVVGDRHDLLPAVLTASYLNIPIAHIQGGERTGSIDEAIRHVVTKFAHIHFPATQGARDLIVQMGEPSESVFVTGCPAIDLLLREPNRPIDEIFSNPFIRMPGTGFPNPEQDFLLLIQHPVTTEYDAAYAQMTETLLAIDDLGMQTILIYPNLDAGSSAMVAAIRHHQTKLEAPNLGCYKHIPKELFFQLLRLARCVVGNSSAGIRESCYFGTPVVNIGTRQNNRENGSNVITVPHDREAIREGIRRQCAHGPYPVEKVYGSGNAGSRIAEILVSANLKAQK